MIERVDHIAIAVWDIDASLSYYKEELGMALVHDEVLLAVGVRLAYFDAGNTFIQLVQPTTSPSIRQFLAEHGEGLHHICYAVPSIPQALQQLSGEAQAQIFHGGRGRRCTFLLNHPNGLTTELTESEPYTSVPTTQSYEQDLDAALLADAD